MRHEKRLLQNAGSDQKKRTSQVGCGSLFFQLEFLRFAEFYFDWFYMMSKTSRCKFLKVLMFFRDRFFYLSVFQFSLCRKNKCLCLIDCEEISLFTFELFNQIYSIT